MRTKALFILMISLVAVGYQSCDSSTNIDKPKDFYKYIGGDGDQAGVDFVTDGNDNIFILGNSTSISEGQQLYAVMTTPEGNVLWEKTFGDPGFEDARDIELTMDGNLVLVANRTDIATSEKDFVIYRLNSSDGSIIGTKTITGTANIADYANSITQTSDGFIVSAYADNGSYKSGAVFRYDVNMALYPFWDGDIASVFRSSSTSTGYDVIPTKIFQFDATTFYTFGYTNSPLFDTDGVSDYSFFVFVSNEFNVATTPLMLPGPDGASNERLTSVKHVPPQSGSGFVLSGYVSKPGAADEDLYVVRVKEELKNIPPSNTSSYMQGDPKTVTSDLAPISSSHSSIFPSSGSGFYLLGNQNQSGNSDIFLTKLDNLLEEAWSDPHKTVSFGGTSDDLPGAVGETKDGRILIVGTMGLGDLRGQTKIVLMNLSPNGMLGE